MREFSHKLVTLFLTMTEGRGSKASLKREIDEILTQIFEIDLRIQSFQSQG